MSMTLNMTLTQQRHIAFLITDYLSNACQPMLADDFLEPSVRTKLENVLSADNIEKYVGELASRKAPSRQTKKILTDEQIEQREAAKVARKADRDRIREEKKAAKQAERVAARAAKKAAAGPGWTTKEITDSDGNIMKGINNASLRVAKRKDIERGLWPRDQILMKVTSNWSDENKAEFQRQFGTPMILTATNKTLVAPNMASILEAAVASETTAEPVVASETTAEPVVASETKTEPAVAEVAGETKTNKPSAIIASNKEEAAKKKLARKEALAKKKLERKQAFAKKKADLALKKAEEKRLAVAEEKRLAVAEEKRLADKSGGETKDGGSAINDGDMDIESSGEMDFSDEEDDTPQPWNHHSYNGDENLFKDEDNGIYRYDDESADFEIIGFYFKDAEGDIAADTLQLD